METIQLEVSIPSGEEQLIIRVPAGKICRILCVDEYAATRGFPYYQLDMEGRGEGFEVEAISDPDLTGCQAEPTVTDERNRKYRYHWSPQDNLDNQDVFKEFGVQLNVPETPGEMRAITILRWVKYFYDTSSGDGPGGGSGRHDRPRKITLTFHAQ